VTFGIIKTELESIALKITKNCLDTNLWLKPTDKLSNKVKLVLSHENSWYVYIHKLLSWMSK